MSGDILSPSYVLTPFYSRLRKTNAQRVCHQGHIDKKWSSWAQTLQFSCSFSAEPPRCQTTAQWGKKWFPGSPAADFLSLILHCLGLGHTAGRKAGIQVSLFQPIGRWGCEGQLSTQPAVSATVIKATVAFVTGERSWCTKGFGESLRSQGYLPMGENKLPLKTSQK